MKRKAKVTPKMIPTKKLPKEKAFDLSSDDSIYIFNINKITPKNL